MIILPEVKLAYSWGEVNKITWNCSMSKSSGVDTWILNDRTKFCFMLFKEFVSQEFCPVELTCFMDGLSTSCFSILECMTSCYHFNTFDCSSRYMNFCEAAAMNQMELQNRFSFNPTFWGSILVCFCCYIKRRTSTAKR